MGGKGGLSEWNWFTKAVMITKEQKERYKKYLQSKEWANIKLDIIQTRGQKCERCGAKRKRFRYLHLHHLTYENLFNERPEDLELLCAPCHRAEHGIGKKRVRDKKKKKPKPKQKVKLTKREKRIKKEMRVSRNEQARYNRIGR